MKKCNCCGINYDPVIEEMKFNAEKVNRYIDYFKLEVNYCAKCALQAVKEKKNNIFKYSCSKCPRKCDYGIECDKLNDYFNRHQAIKFELIEFWTSGYCCAECAIKRIP